ncbi:MAG: hypothetical protein ACKPGT_03325, partial [Microcystis sp.]
IKLIGEKKALKPQKTEKPSNVVSHPKFSGKPLETDKLGETIDNLISDNVTGSKLKINLASIAREYGLTDQQVSSIYKEKIEETDRKSDYDDALHELETILINDNGKINLSRLLPEPLAKAIQHHAKLTGLRSEAYLTALLSGLSSTLHPHSIKHY